jgi:hypothetical protein
MKDGGSSTLKKTAVLLPTIVTPKNPYSGLPFTPRYVSGIMQKLSRIIFLAL